MHNVKENNFTFGWMFKGKEENDQNYSRQKFSKTVKRDSTV